MKIYYLFDVIKGLIYPTMWLALVVLKHDERTPTVVSLIEHDINIS